MNIATNKNFKFIFIASITALISCIVSAPEVKAAQFSFEDLEGTDPAQTFWDHSAVGGSSNSNGWSDGLSNGTATKDGITITVNSTFVGTAKPGTDNLKSKNSNDSTRFILSHIDKSDLNSSSLTNYQRIDLSFSEPVIFESFAFGDIDTTDNANDNTAAFVDALGAEGFNSGFGSPGTGLAPVYDLTNSELVVETISGVDYVNRNTALYGYKNVPLGDDPSATANISFTEGVTAASLYYFNDANSTNSTATHGISLNNSTFSVRSARAVPFEFSPALGLIASGMFFVALKVKRARKENKVLEQSDSSLNPTSFG